MDKPLTKKKKGRIQITSIRNERGHHCIFHEHPKANKEIYEQCCFVKFDNLDEIPLKTQDATTHTRRNRHSE